MAWNRKIIKIKLDDIVYSLGELAPDEHQELVVTLIKFYRDGLLDVNPAQACFAITMSPRNDDKKKIIKVVPYDKLDQLTYVEIPKKEDEGTCETASQMRAE
jgi:hypothetical protein